MPSIEFDGLEVNVYRSEDDDSLVVDITGPDGEDCKATDVDEDGSPKLRVWLNEARLYENPQKGEPFTAVLMGNLSEGFRAIGPFEDFAEAHKHCDSRSYMHPTWIVSLNAPHAKEEDFVD